MQRRRSLLLISLLALAISCKKQEAVASDEREARQVATASAATTEAAKSGEGSAPLPRPHIIRTADIQLSVKEVGKTSDLISSLVDARLGYVATSRNWSENGRAFSSLVVRIPEAKLSEFIRALHGIGATIESESIRGDDVTQEYVDLGARLKNLQATEVELRALLTSVRERSQKASEVLEIHREVVSIRGQIEEAQGRLNYLQQMTSYATVNISIGQHGLEKPLQEAWTPMVTVRDATRALITTAQFVAEILIWVGIYLLPILLTLMLLLYGAIRLRRVMA